MRVHNRNHQLIFTGYMNYLLRACYCEVKESLYIHYWNQTLLFIA